MELVVVTPIRLFGEGLAACFLPHAEITLRATVSNLQQLCGSLDALRIDVALIDVTQGVDLDDVRAIVSEHSATAFVALGLEEQRQHVIRCGRAGFSGYVARNASVEELCRALSDAVAGRLACSAEISGGLLRALFNRPHAATLDEALTRREGEVLLLIGRGFSNKEIATELSLSIATVKHHVHHILGKLQLPRRAQAMRRVREMPWIAASPSLDPDQREV
jgi:two-component system nitrate/nitrite response regulator NarL